MVESLKMGITLVTELSTGDIVVGGGTIALAAVTAWLARKTGQDVDLTRESIEAGDRPFLVGTPGQFAYMPTFDRYMDTPTGSEWALEVKLENWGRGPAIFDGVSLKQESGTELVPDDWEVEMALTPGDERDAAVGIGDVEPPAAGTEAVLRLFYRSASGIRYERLTQSVSRESTTWPASTFGARLRLNNTDPGLCVLGILRLCPSARVACALCHFRPHT